jgi:hypothetical protein
MESLTASMNETFNKTATSMNEMLYKSQASTETTLEQMQHAITAIANWVQALETRLSIAPTHMHERRHHHRLWPPCKPPPTLALATARHLHHQLQSPQAGVPPPARVHYFPNHPRGHCQDARTPFSNPLSRSRTRVRGLVTKFKTTPHVSVFKYLNTNFGERGGTKPAKAQ